MVEAKTKLGVFLAIIILAAFLRLYQISGYMTFLGDEGRDALIIQDILINHHIPFIGPPASVGNVYLGPLYYYLMAVSMSVWWLNPIAAASMVALFGVATVGLMFYLTNRWFGFWSALVAAFLYTISPVTIIYSRSSWNPNPAPLFSLLAIYFFSKNLKKPKIIWFFLTGLMVGAAVQMHYMALILIPTLALIWIYRLIKKSIGGLYLLGPLSSIFGFLLILTPWLLFDFKHNFLNTRALVEIFTGSSSSVGFDPKNFILRFNYTFVHDLVSRYLTGNNIILASLVSALILGQLIYLIWKKKGSSSEALVLISWLAVGCLGLALYKYQLYDHYLGFLSPAPYIALGSVVFSLRDIRIQKLRMLAVGLYILLFISLTLSNLSASPLKNPPNNQLERTKLITHFIINQSGDKPFNFALLAKNNYDSAYQFYLDQYGHKPKPLPFEMTTQLFVVCEDNPCNPINNPKYEIAAFGWAKIKNSWDVFGVKIYQLVANPSGKPS